MCERRLSVIHQSQAGNACEVFGVFRNQGATRKDCGCGDVQIHRRNTLTKPFLSCVVLREGWCEPFIGEVDVKALTHGLDASGFPCRFLRQLSAHQQFAEDEDADSYLIF